MSLALRESPAVRPGSSSAFVRRQPEPLSTGLLHSDRRRSGIARAPARRADLRETPEETAARGVRRTADMRCASNPETTNEPWLDLILRDRPNRARRSEEYPNHCW